MAKIKLMNKAIPNEEGFDYASFEKEAIGWLYEGDGLVGEKGVLTSLIQLLLPTDLLLPNLQPFSYPVPIKSRTNIPFARRPEIYVGTNAFEVSSLCGRTKRFESLFSREQVAWDIIPGSQKAQQEVEGSILRSSKFGIVLLSTETRRKFLI